MKESILWRGLRYARYELPDRAGRLFPGPDAAALRRRCERLKRQGRSATIGFFDMGAVPAEEIIAAYEGVLVRLDKEQAGTHLAIKVPPLDFRHEPCFALAQAAQAKGLSLTFDAHATSDADLTLEIVERLLPAFPETGCVLPGRWRRSLTDGARFRDSSARLRIVKGEWPDEVPHAGDEKGRGMDAAYLDLVSRLAGRAAPVGIATHKPALAEQALRLLLDAGTPCELEQIRGLPQRRTLAVARRLGVPVRFYLPFGPGWAPYVINEAMTRPYLAGWMLRDLLGLRDPA